MSGTSGTQDGWRATQTEIDEPTAVSGHAPRTYESIVKEVLPV